MSVCVHHNQQTPPLYMTNVLTVHVGRVLLCLINFNIITEFRILHACVFYMHVLTSHTPYHYTPLLTPPPPQTPSHPHTPPFLTHHPSSHPHTTSSSNTLTHHPSSHTTPTHHSSHHLLLKHPHTLTHHPSSHTHTPPLLTPLLTPPPPQTPSHTTLPHTPPLHTTPHTTSSSNTLTPSHTTPPQTPTPTHHTLLTDSPETSKRKNLERLLRSVLTCLLRNPPAVEDLVRCSDVSLLFGMVSLPCPAHNKMWRKTAAECLITICR